MRIEALSAQNFKSFEHIDLPVHGKSVVIFGVNGAGKSTLLSIINYLFWGWIYRINPSQGTAYRSLEADMVRVGKSSLSLGVKLKIEGADYMLEKSYARARAGKAAAAVSSKQAYAELVEAFVSAYLKDSRQNMPIFAHYGTNRSVLDIPLRIRKKHDGFSKETALERCIENELDFRTFFEWFRNQEDLENEQKAEKNDLGYEDRALRCVRSAISAMLDGITSIRVKRSPLRMVAKKGKNEFNVNLLSDGEKCALALLGDLARRVALANPNRENPLDGEGIVLIDEIELHMHPAWQRKVLHVLKELFPNIQFVITTHSPQILGSVDDRYLLCKLSVDPQGTKLDWNRIVTFGKTSNDILKNDMNTSERDEKAQRLFDAFYSYLDDGKYAEAEQILEQLNEMQPNDPEIAACYVRLSFERM